MTTNVRNLTTTDNEAWHRLWDGYCEFYGVDIPDDVTAETWQRLNDPQEPSFFGLVAERNGEVIGIANCILHGTTWAKSPRCYLNDLFVDPDSRGSGAGKALIDRIRQLGVEEGWDKIHWLTAESNATARRLYDQYAPATAFVQYSIPPQESE